MTDFVLFVSFRRNRLNSFEVYTVESYIYIYKTISCAIIILLL